MFGVGLLARDLPWSWQFTAEAGLADSAYPTITRKPMPLRPMKRFLMTLLRVLLAGAAIWALLHQSADLHPDKVAREIQAYGWRHMGLGVGATVASFLLLGVLEVVAVRYAAQSMRTSSDGVLFGTSFVANALSQSIGLSVLTGAAVRARVYARHGLSAAAIARTTAFITLTATLGLLASGSVALIAAPPKIVTDHFAVTTTPLGLLLGGIVAAYLLWSVFGTQSHVGRGRWALPRPSSRIAVAQIALSVADWVLVGTVLFAFLPSSLGLRYGIVLGAFAVAQLLAVASHVPAGAGVFELSVLGLLARAASSTQRASIVAALVMYRLCYYLAPLVIALCAAIGWEWTRRGSSNRNAPNRTEQSIEDATLPYAC